VENLESLSRILKNCAPAGVEVDLKPELSNPEYAPLGRVHQLGQIYCLQSDTGPSCTFRYLFEEKEKTNYLCRWQTCKIYNCSSACLHFEFWTKPSAITLDFAVGARVLYQLPPENTQFYFPIFNNTPFTGRP
jgi:hypothetical protein